MNNDPGVLHLTGAQIMGSMDWQANLAKALRVIEQAAEAGAQVVVLPENTLYCRAHASDPLYGQALDGPFVQALQKISAQKQILVIAGMGEPAEDGRIHNTLVALAEGERVAQYRKLHLYDAFAVKESDEFVPGVAPPPVFSWRGFSFGLMTCYDIRFPEQARYLAERGADVLVVPTAWFAGAQKEWHWKIMCAARALENGVYLAGIDLCGNARIGCSQIVDPMGVAIAQLGGNEGLLSATLEKRVLQQACEAMPLLAQRRFAISDKPLPPGYFQ